MTTTPIFDSAHNSSDAKSAFRRARKTENDYAQALRRIAKHVDDIVRAFMPAGGGEIPQAATEKIEQTLFNYADAIRGWAEATANRMLTEMDARDRRAWMAAARKIGEGIAKEVASAGTGAAFNAAMARQVQLITSLPREAAERVHKLAIENLSSGGRASELAKGILKTGDVTKSRANLIARTETGRASVELSKARAEKIGSTHFIWRTAGDSDVRPSHAKLNGKVFRWDQPPECDPGHYALPGAIWNCRCYAEPLIND